MTSDGLLSQKNRYLPLSSGFSDNADLSRNSTWSPEELQNIGSNRYMIQRRNTKIIFECVLKYYLYNGPHDRTIPKLLLTVHKHGLNHGIMTYH